MELDQFIEKWGRWVEINEGEIRIKSQHLVRRWKVSFDADVKKLPSEFKIVCDFSD